MTNEEKVKAAVDRAASLLLAGAREKLYEELEFQLARDGLDVDYDSVVELAPAVESAMSDMIRFEGRL